MSEWPSSRLGDLVSFEKGRKVEVSHHPKDGFAPYLGADVLAGGEATIYADTNIGVLAGSHDVLMLWDGERSGLVGKGRPGVVSSTVAKLTPKAGIDATFLYYALYAKFDWIQGRRTGTGVPHVPRDLGRILQIHHPTQLLEQRRIAEILSTVDEAIEQTEALIAKTQAIKAGLMHDLFTRGVLPDGRLRPPREEAPELYKESPLGWIPREWEVDRLGQILDSYGGYLQTGPFGSQLHAHEYEPEGVPVVMPQDINEGGLSTNNIARIPESRARELSRHRMRCGDVVIARRGDLSRAAAIGSANQGWVCGTGCFLLRLERSALQADFAAYAYRQSFVQRQISGIAVGTTMPSLNNSVMAELFFPLCGVEEQRRIVDRLHSVERAVGALRDDVLVTRKVKDGLMHELLTERVRVDVVQSGETKE